jgi:hypothetical protein
MRDLTLTLLASKKPAIISKSFTLDADGTLAKLPGGQLIKGTAKRVTPTLEQFVELLGWMQPKHALCFGTFAGPDEALVVPKDKVNEQQQREQRPVIARTRDYFSWPEGPGILFGDYDPQPDGPVLKREELLAIIYSVWPELKARPHIWTSSASSSVYRSDTGEELRPISGQRLYVPVFDARDIPRAGEILFQRLWLAGHGRYDVSKSGSLLERSPLDGSVFQCERLDFAGGANCGPGLEQRRPKPMVFNADQSFIDSRTLCDLTPDEQELLENIKAEARKAKKPEIEQRREEWITERLADKSPEVAAQWRGVLESAVKEKRLLGDFVLHSPKYGKVTVSTMLDNPDKYHGARLADPLEPDYGNDKRIAWVNLRAAGRPYIFSHAHGGARFTLHRAMQTIRIEGGELHNIVSKVLELSRLDGGLFVRGAELVRLAGGKIYPVTPGWLSVYLTSLAKFEKFDKRNETWRPIDCPATLAKNICEMTGEWRLPFLRSILTAPTMTPNGGVIDCDGFDEETGIYLDFPDSNKWPGIPANIPDDQVAKAIKALWLPFRDFPFVCSVDRGVALSAILTAPVRSLLPTAPGFAFVAPCAGSGKTLAAKSVARIASCEPPAMLPKVDTDDELRKRLFALARGGAHVIVLDNLTGSVESEALCAYLTAETLSDRILGISTMGTVPANAMVILTGNNINMTGDLNRRILKATIDPQMEFPHARRFELHPEFYIKENRITLVHSALLILSAFLRSRTAAPKDSMASFEAWSDLIRQAVIWIGQRGWLDVGDPAESISKSYEEDPESNKLRALLVSWRDAFGNAGGTVTDAIARATRRSKDEYESNPLTEVEKTLRDAIENITGKAASDKGGARLLGWWMVHHAGRISAQMKLLKSGVRKERAIWSVSPVSSVCQGHMGGNGKDWIYIGQHENSDKSDGTDRKITCGGCANFQPNSTNPSFQGHCLGTPPDEDRSRFPNLEVDCSEFRARPPETHQQYRQASTAEGFTQ